MKKENKHLHSVNISESEALSIVSILRNLIDLMAITKAVEQTGALDSDKENITNFFQRNNIQDWDIFKQSLKEVRENEN